jgi:hypothetical protein
MKDAIVAGVCVWMTIAGLSELMGFRGADVVWLSLTVVGIVGIYMFAKL